MVESPEKLLLKSQYPGYTPEQFNQASVATQALHVILMSNQD